MKKRMYLIMLIATICAMAACNSGNKNNKPLDNSATTMNGPDTSGTGHSTRDSAMAAVHPENPSPVDTATVSFVTKSARGGLMEVASGKLAQAKGQSADVRNFGSRMVADHSRINAQLTKLVTDKQLSMPSAPPEDPMLNNTRGSDFDLNYVRMMLKDHEEDVKDFQKAADNLPDKDVGNFARQTLPVLKDHLSRIKEIAAKMRLSAN